MLAIGDTYCINRGAYLKITMADLDGNLKRVSDATLVEAPKKSWRRRFFTHALSPPELIREGSIIHNIYILMTSSDGISGLKAT